MRQKGIQHRRDMVLQMVNEQPHRNWSSYEIAEEAQKLDWFKDNMPTYSHMTAYRDWLAIKEETKENREKLAEQFLVEQLDQTDEQIRSILQDLDSLGTIEEYLGGMNDIDIGDLTQFVKAKNTLLNALNRLQNKQADLVPINLPKKVQVDRRSFSFDYYLEVHQQHQHELNGSPKKKLGDGIIDGEYEVE